MKTIETLNKELEMVRIERFELAKENNEKVVNFFAELLQVSPKQIGTDHSHGISIKRITDDWFNIIEIDYLERYGETKFTEIRLRNRDTTNLDEMILIGKVAKLFKEHSSAIMDEIKVVYGDFFEKDAELSTTYYSIEKEIVGLKKIEEEAEKENLLNVLKNGGIELKSTCYFRTDKGRFSATKIIIEKETPTMVDFAFVLPLGNIFTQRIRKNNPFYHEILSVIQKNK